MRVQTLIAAAALLTLTTAACDTSLVGADSDVEAYHTVADDTGLETTIGTPPAPPTPEELCDQRADRIARRVDAAREAAGGCQVDADCTTSFANVSCDRVQGDVWPVSFTGKSGFEAAVRAIDEAECVGWDPDAADPCPVAIMDWFTPPRSVCVEGMCQVEAGSMACTEPNDEGVAPLGVADTTEGCLDCGLAAAKARAQVDAAVATVNACEVDSDCVIVSDATGCDATCGVAINASAAEGWDGVLDAAHDAYCAANGGCPVAMVDCLPTIAVCDAGACRAVAEPQDVVCDVE